MLDDIKVILRLIQFWPIAFSTDFHTSLFANQHNYQHIIGCGVSEFHGVRGVKKDIRGGERCENMRC